MAILAVLLLLAVIVIPQVLVRAAIARHAVDRPDLPGTGGELARHLLDHYGLAHVKVEAIQGPDHFDPVSNTVRLGAAHHAGRSVSAVAVAAHEVSHALQHAEGDRLLALRQRLGPVVAFTDQLAGLVFIASPFLAALARTPIALIALVGGGIALLGVRVVFNLITLPVEIDASFGRALPILKEGRYIVDNDLPAVRSVLRAAAFTYLAGALISLVNLWRWVRLIR